MPAKKSAPVGPGLAGHGRGGPSPPSLCLTVERYYQDLRRVVRERTGCAFLAEDVVQDTWLKAAGVSGINPRNAEAYVRRMAINIALDHLRREALRSRIGEMLGCDGSSGLAAGAAKTTEEAIASKQEAARIVTAIREMPEKRRAAFLLYRVDGLTMRQVGLRLGISERTVEKHVARALLDCRRRLLDER
ncbi:MAG: RNA polymerase sigma factor [Pseudomonadota bacterium]